MKVKRKLLTPEQALVRLETLCARGERCTDELRTRLRNWQISSGDSESIIKSLKDRRFVDDLRFAQAFVRDRYRNAGYGRLRLRMSLNAKRIPAEIINQALNEIDEEIYLDTLRRVLKSKMAHADITTFEGRTKIYRHGVYRGYESTLVSSTLKQLLRAVQQ